MKSRILTVRVTKADYEGLYPYGVPVPQVYAAIERAFGHKGWSVDVWPTSRTFTVYQSVTSTVVLFRCPLPSGVPHLTDDASCPEFTMRFKAVLK